MATLSCPGIILIINHIFQLPSNTMSFPKTWLKNPIYLHHLKLCFSADLGNLGKWCTINMYQETDTDTLVCVKRCWKSVSSCSQRPDAITGHLKRSQIAPKSEEGVAKSMHFRLKGSLHQHEMSKVKMHVIKSTMGWCTAHLIFLILYTQGHRFQDFKIFTRVCA